MKLKINRNSVTAFINDKPQYSLTVKRLAKIKSKKIAFFVADNTGGDFEYVIIK